MAYKIKKSKPMFIKEPYGLPFELQEKGKCEDGICMLPEQELKKSTE